jgi:lipopolysaccharide assembly outer membrane protein LptD (OstA)
MKNILLIILSALCLLAFVGAGEKPPFGDIAATKEMPAITEKPATKTPPVTKKVNIQTTKIHSVKQDGDVRITTLVYAKITQDDSVMTADNIVMKSKDDVHEFTCTGNPVFKDPETTITAQTLQAFSSPRRAEFSNNVKMVTTPKKKDSKAGDMKKNMNEPSVITCELLSYDYANKKALAKKNVIVTQKTRIIKADQAIYDRDSELITMNGNIEIKNIGEKNKSDLNFEELKNADTVTVSVKDDWIDIAAKKDETISITVDVKDDEKK